MRFLYYDILFLIIFSVALALFLYKNRKKLEIESKVLILYKTKIGIKIMDTISKKFPVLINILSYLSIFSGYILMSASIPLLLLILWIIANAPVVPSIPPIFPLIPYITEIFDLPFLPMFYFTYWIIAIAIVAVCHEFMHGLFARFGKIDVKSTGFGFLGPFLAFFVEPDEKQAEKKPIKTQLSVISGGSFANLLLVIIFVAVINIFFFSLYSPAGMKFDDYAFSALNILNATSIGNIGISNATFEKLSLACGQLNVNKTENVKITVDGKDYFANAGILEALIKSKGEYIYAYDDTPAYRSRLSGAIKEIKYNNLSFLIKNYTDLSSALEKLNPGENITLVTTTANYTTTLANHPLNSSKAYIGVRSDPGSRFITLFTNFILVGKKDFSTYYEPKFGGELSRLTVFIYNLLFWIILINASVMLANMIPFAIFDGGRFFYLTMLGITKSKKSAEKWFSIINSAILMLIALMMAIWLFRIF